MYCFETFSTDLHSCSVRVCNPSPQVGRYMRADDKSDNAELIRRILGGDRNAFSALCAMYAARLHAFVLKRVHNREDTQEIVQDVFVRVSQNLETLKASERLLNWMFSIASQLIVARYREHRTHLEYTSVDGVSALHEEASLTAYRVSQQQAEENELLEIVSRAIDILPDLDRKVMRCAGFGMSYREIAHELVVTEAAVKHRLYRARRRVKELVDGMEED